MKFVLWIEWLFSVDFAYHGQYYSKYLRLQLYVLHVIALEQIPISRIAELMCFIYLFIFEKGNFKIISNFLTL